MATCTTSVVKVKRERLKTCMTCPLCNKLIKEATTVSLCLHTFCRKCIYKKLSDEEEDSCPLCNIDLGAIPVEKLRPDHSLQDIRAEVFPMKSNKLEPSEVVPSVSLPLKRKEKSLSSLVVSTPKVPMQTGLTSSSRRSKGVSRKAALEGSRFSAKGRVTKEEDISGDHSISSSLQDSLMQDSSSAEVFNSRRFDKDITKENNVEVTKGKFDPWTPLNCLVEAASRSKSSRGASQWPRLANLEQPFNDNKLNKLVDKSESEWRDAADGVLSMSKNKIQEHGRNTWLKNENNGVASLSRPVKHKRLRTASRKKETVSEEFNADAGFKENRRNSPVWFTLVASGDQKGDVSLPQISSSYLRIKDGSVPVSFIQKYVVRKLNLTSEAEVEIMCRGEPVLPTLQLHNLVDLWFRTSSTTRRIPATVGTSAKEFVMVLSYCRKVQAA